MVFPKSYLTADEHSKLSPEDQARYVKHEASGGFMFGLESVGGWRLEDVDGLSSSLQKERATARKFAGLDPEAAKAAMQRVAELEAEMEKGGGKLTKDEREAIRKSVADAYEKEKQALIAERDALDAGLRDYIVENAATAAIAKHGANLKLLMPHVKGAIRAVKGDDGKYRPRVVGADGTELPSRVSGSAHLPMAPDEYVGSMLKSEYPEAFPGTGSSGSGATSTNGHGGHSRIDPSLPPSERLKAARRAGMTTG